MVRFLEDHFTDTMPAGAEETAAVLDLGTGNGQLLLAVWAGGFRGPMTGLDYSKASVEFAAKVVQKEVQELADDGEEEEAEAMKSRFTFRHADFLAEDNWNEAKEKWDVVLDKGTLDAIALADTKYSVKIESGDGSEAVAKTGVQVYPVKVAAMLAPGTGLFLITSCNFTEPELVALMEGSGLFEKAGRVEYPAFWYGGVKGQTVSTVAFKLKE